MMIMGRNRLGSRVSNAEIHDLRGCNRTEYTSHIATRKFDLFVWLEAQFHKPEEPGMETRVNFMWK